MNINHLRYLIEVCKQKNMTKAAEKLHVSQPAITAAIKDLEKELGYQILNRVNNKLTLTNEGERLLALSTDMVKYFDDFNRKALDCGTKHRHVLNIGIPAILSTFFLENIIPDFESENPDISLIIHETPTITGLEMVENASLDFLIGVLDDKVANNFEHMEIFDTELVVFMNRQNPLSKLSVIKEPQLKGVPFVMVPKGSSHYKAITSRFNVSDLNVVFHSTQVSAIENMLQNHQAVTIMYDQVFRKNDQIVAVPLETPIKVQVSIFWKKNTYRNSAMKKFTTFIKEERKTFE